MPLLAASASPTCCVRWASEEVRSVIAEQGAVTVTCEFCQKPYKFDAHRRRAAVHRGRAARQRRDQLTTSVSVP